MDIFKVKLKKVSNHPPFIREQGRPESKDRRRDNDRCQGGGGVYVFRQVEGEGEGRRVKCWRQMSYKKSQPECPG